MAEEGSAEVVVVADTSQFRRTFSADMARAGRDAGDALDDALTRSLAGTGARIGRQVSRDVQRSLRGVTASVRVEPDMRAFRASLQAQTSSLPPISVRVVPDTSRFRDDLQRALRGMPPLVIPTTTAPTPGGDGGDDGDRSRGIRRTTDALGELGRVGATVGRVVAGALRFTAMAGGVLYLAGALGSLVVALAPAAGALAALPAVILGAQVAMAALRLATAGVGEAFGAALTGDAEAFKKSLEGLPPAAANAAREMRTLRDEFTGLRNSVSGAFFKPLEGQFKALAPLIGPGGVVRKGLTAIAGEFGNAARGALDYITSSAGLANIGKVMSGTRAALSGLSALAKPLTETFLQMAGSVSAAFGPQLRDALTNAADALKRFNEGGNAGSKAVEWVQGAIDLFGQLMDVIRPLAGIFLDLSGAVNAGGGGGLTGLANVLTVVREAIQPLLPAVQTLSAAFAEGLGNLAPSLLPLAAAFGQILTALAPLLPMIGTFLGIAAQIAAVILQILAPFAPFIAGLLALAKAFQIVSAAVTFLRTAWMLLQLAFAINPFALIIAAIAALVAIIVIIATRTTWFQTAWQFMVDAVVAGWNWLWGILSAGFDALMVAVEAVGRFFSETLPGFFSAAWSAIVDIVSSLVTSVTDFFSSMWDTITSTVSAGIDAVIDFFAGIWGAISGALTSLGNSVGDFFSGMMDTAKNFVSDGIDGIVDFFSGIWDSIKGFLNGLKDNVVNFFENLIPDIDIPFLADGGIISGPTVAVVGEAGPEVVIPLTRPARAMELMRQSGLLNLAQGAGNTVNNTFNVNSRASDPMALAHVMAGHIARAAGV